MKGLTLQRLYELLEYDKDTGVLTWRVGRRPGARAGDAAGTRTKAGYIRVKVEGIYHFAHRLAYYYVHKEEPVFVDHINGIKTDNRIVNLRSVTQKQNCRNRVSGGTDFKKDKEKRQWRARIGFEYKSIHLGYFDTEQEANEAYLAAKKKYHPECERFEE